MGKGKNKTASPKQEEPVAPAATAAPQAQPKPKRRAPHVEQLVIPPLPKTKKNFLAVLLDKYYIETALYMLEWWERWILNTLLVVFLVFMAYYAYQTTKTAVEFVVGV